MLISNLKKIRMQESMMNSKEFAAHLGISISQYHKYEKMLTQPILETALRIAKKLDRSVHTIWYIEEQAQK